MRSTAVRRPRPAGDYLAPAMLALALVLAGCGGSEPAAEEAGGAVPEASGPSPAASVPADPATLLPNGKLVGADLLVGGQPSEEQFARMADAGYRTVINLRTPGEPQVPGEEIEALGLIYVSLPVDHPEEIDEEHARALSAALAEAERPVVVHCGSGNRVGALLALEAHHVEGKPAEEALAEGLASGLTHLEPVVRERLGLGAEE